MLARKVLNSLMEENMGIKDHMPQAYARRLAQAVSRFLKERYGARKVLLIGSLAIGAAYNPDFSDIDVCFEGIHEEMVASAQADCRKNFGERDSLGRKRIDYLSVNMLPRDVMAGLRRTAVEI